MTESANTGFLDGMRKLPPFGRQFLDTFGFSSDALSIFQRCNKNADAEGEEEGRKAD